MVADRTAVGPARSCQVAPLRRSPPPATRFRPLRAAITYVNVLPSLARSRRQVIDIVACDDIPPGKLRILLDGELLTADLRSLQVAGVSRAGALEERHVRRGADGGPAVTCGRR